MGSRSRPFLEWGRGLGCWWRGGGVVGCCGPVRGLRIGRCRTEHQQRCPEAVAQGQPLGTALPEHGLVEDAQETPLAAAVGALAGQADRLDGRDDHAIALVLVAALEEAATGAAADAAVGIEADRDRALPGRRGELAVGPGQAPDEPIAGEVRLSLSPVDEERLGETRSVNPVVYEAYLRGMHVLNNASASEDFENAIGYFEAAASPSLDLTKVQICSYHLRNKMCLHFG